MQRNITTVLALLLAALTSATCQNTIAANEVVSMHAEIMGAYDQPAAAPALAQLKIASNISIGSESVYAYYRNAEFILKYCGGVYIELDGNIRTVPAKVFQLEPGVWVAEIEGGQYVKVFAESGNTNTDLDGEFRVFAKN